MSLSGLHVFLRFVAKRISYVTFFSKQMFIFVAEFANPSRLHLLFRVDVSYSDL